MRLITLLGLLLFPTIASADETVWNEQPPLILNAIASHSGKNEIAYISIGCEQPKLRSGIMYTDCARARGSVTVRDGVCKLETTKADIVRFIKQSDGTWVRARTNSGKCDKRTLFVLTPTKDSFWDYSEIIYGDGCKKTVYQWKQSVARSQEQELSCTKFSR